MHSCTLLPIVSPAPLFRLLRLLRVLFGLLLVFGILVVVARMFDVLEAAWTARPGEGRLGPHPELLVRKLVLAQVDPLAHQLKFY
jgi:hypothetical protein